MEEGRVEQASLSGCSKTTRFIFTRYQMLLVQDILGASDGHTFNVGRKNIRDKSKTGRTYFLILTIRFT